MRRTLLIFLSLGLALVGWSTVCAEDGFYVIPAMKGKYAPVPKTGQQDSHGVAWPTPRFTDNNNGTVTDKLTGLIWMKNAKAFGDLPMSLDYAQIVVATVANGTYGLTDGSKAGDWRLPNIRELHSLISYNFYNPALPNTLGTGKYAEGDPFQGVMWATSWNLVYLSSTTYAKPSDPGVGWEYGWAINFWDGSLVVIPSGPGYAIAYVWCVRGGP